MYTFPHANIQVVTKASACKRELVKISVKLEKIPLILCLKENTRDLQMIQDKDTYRGIFTLKPLYRFK